MSTPSDPDTAHEHPGLQVQVERTGPCIAQVRFQVAPDELERSRKKEFATLSRRVRLRGFRPGKIPRPILEKHFGEEVDRGVVEHFVQHAYQTAVEEHGLKPAAYPRVQLESRPTAGEPWNVSFEVLLRPELELGQVEGLAVEGRPITVSEEELEQALAELRRSHSRAEPAAEEGLLEDGMAVATLSFFRPGQRESCLTREGIRLSPKSGLAGVDREAFEAALRGARAGEEREFELVFPANFPVEEARGERGTCRVALKEVFRIVPPDEEELFRSFQVADAQGLRTVVRERLRSVKQEAEDSRVENELLERLIDAHPMELPGRLLDEQVESHLAELRAALEKQGLAPEEARGRAEEERERSRAGGERALRAVYLMEEIARKRDLRVNEQELATELAEIARRNGTPVEEVTRYYREQGLLRQLGLELLERKVRRYLRASAEIRRPS